MPKVIYLVEHGSYDDWWPVAAFTDLEEAKRFAHRLQEFEERRWHEEVLGGESQGGYGEYYIDYTVVSEHRLYERAEEVDLEDPTFDHQVYEVPSEEERMQAERSRTGEDEDSEDERHRLLEEIWTISEHLGLYDPDDSSGEAGTGGW